MGIPGMYKGIYIYIKPSVYPCTSYPCTVYCRTKSSVTDVSVAEFYFFEQLI